MQVTIYNQSKELLLHTVSLAHHEKEEKNIYLFHCPYCSQRTGIQIQGDVVKISPGLDPINDVVTVYHCKDCKRLYTFQTAEFLPKEKTKVTLVAIPGALGIFYCWICRSKLFQFNKEKIIQFPEFNLLQTPFDLRCSAPSCQKSYHIAEII